MSEDILCDLFTGGNGVMICGCVRFGAEAEHSQINIVLRLYRVWLQYKLTYYIKPGNEASVCVKYMYMWARTGGEGVSEMRGHVGVISRTLMTTSCIAVEILSIYLLGCACVADREGQRVGTSLGPIT